MAHRSTPQTPAAPAEPERLITVAEFLDRSTLSRSTFWRLRREDEHLRQAVVQLTPHRVAVREDKANTWIAARAGRR